MNSRDIERRKKAGEALRESEEQYRRLFQNMAEGFALYELIEDEQGRPVDWRILEMNDAYTRHTGIARERIVGRRISEVFPDTVSEYLPRFAHAVATQTAADFETYSKAAGRYLHVVTFPAGGRRFANIVEDITERKRAEEELAAAHRLTQDLIDNTTSMIFACDLEERFVLANAPLAALLKTTPAQLVGKRRVEFMAQADADAHEANDRKVIAAGRAAEFEEHSDLHGRSIVWLTTKFPLRDAQGRIYGVAGIVTDITARKQAEAALRESEARMQQALQVSRSFTFDWRPSTDEVVRSASCAAILKLSGDEAVTDTGRRYFERVHPDDRDRFVQTIRNLTPASSSYLAKYRVSCGDGSVVVLEEIGQAAFDSAGALARLVGVTTDITARKQAEDELRRRAEALRAANEELTRFNRAMVDREVRMVEIKKEVNGLCAELGSPPRYRLDCFEGEKG